MVEDDRFKAAVVVALFAIAAFFGGLVGWAWTGTWQYATTGLAVLIVGVLAAGVVSRT